MRIVEDLPPLGDSLECRLDLAFYLKAPTARTCGCRRLNNITSKLLLFTLVTGLSTTAPPFSSDLRGHLLHLAKFRTPIWEIEACHRPGKPRRVPKVAGGARGRYQTCLWRQPIWCYDTPELQIHQYKVGKIRPTVLYRGVPLTHAKSVVLTQRNVLRCRKSAEKRGDPLSAKLGGSGEIC
jgi:hypothetical protein